VAATAAGSKAWSVNARSTGSMGREGIRAGVGSRERSRESPVMTGTQLVSWLDQPADHDYPAAASYLALLAAPDEIKQWVAVLKTTPQLRFKAKDILRAARLALLPIDNPHVASDLKKIKAGKALSPILLVRGDLGSGIALQVADGYHRVCASYHTDENTDIPCRVAPRGPGR